MSSLVKFNVDWIKDSINRSINDIQNGYQHSSLCIITYNEDDLLALLSELEYLKIESGFMTHIIEGSKGISARDGLEECYKNYGNENPLIIVVKNFDLIDPKQQFAYSKIINMEDTSLMNKIKEGSVLILLTKKGEKMNLKPGWLSVVEFGKGE